MYLNGFTILVILSSQCLLTACNEGRGCQVHINPKESRWPIPFTYEYRSKIINPDQYGYLRFPSNKSIELSCTNYRFIMPATRGRHEITVTCIVNKIFAFEGYTYSYDQFKCQGIPRSRMIVTSHRCQNDAHVAAVGFQGLKRFFIFFNICFDKVAKNPLYTWYFVNAPHKSNTMRNATRNVFIKSKQFYGEEEVHFIYRSQANMLLITLGSTELVKKYYKPRNATLLVQAHLVGRTEFYYGFQQDATYYFENTVPLWRNFYHDIWIHVEQVVSKRLQEGSNIHMITTGTFQVFSLPDVNNVSVPLYLKHPNRVPVPKFVWKMDYETGGIVSPRVIIGLNSPSYQKDYPIDSPLIICETIACPYVIQAILEDANYGLVYCCTKRAFERVYGNFKPIMFHKNLI